MSLKQIKKSNLIEIDIAILQLSRFGDILQTLCAFNRLRESFKFKKCSILFIGRKKFCSRLKFLLKESFDYFEFIGDDYDGDEDSFYEAAVNSYDDFFEKIKNYKIQKMVNLTFSDLSAFLMTHIESNEKIGIIKLPNDLIRITDKWCQYVFSTVMRGQNNPFNLVDIIYNIIFNPIKEFIEGRYDKKDISKLNKFINIDLDNKYKNLICNEMGTFSRLISIHPFASTKSKRIELNIWINLIRSILLTNPFITIALIGSKQDAKELEGYLLSLDIFISNKRLLNFVGKISVEETFYLIKNSKVFIGHDSMCGHLAAYARVPSITFFTGQTRPYETLPFGVGNIGLFITNSFSKSEFNFIESTSMNLLITNKLETIVHDCLDIIFEVNQIENRIPEFINLNHKYNDIKNIIQFYFSEILNDKNDDILILNNFIKSKSSTIEVFKSIYFIIWDFYLNDREIVLEIPLIEKELEYTLQEYLQGAKYLIDLFQFGVQYSRFIIEETTKKNKSKEYINDYVEKIKEIDKLSLSLSNKYPYLCPIIEFFYIGRSNLSGFSLNQISTSSMMNFQEAVFIVQIFEELLVKILSNQKREFHENLKNNSNSVLL